MIYIKGKVKRKKGRRKKHQPCGNVTYIFLSFSKLLISWLLSGVNGDIVPWTAG